jgi:hypothetical protein
VLGIDLETPSFRKELLGVLLSSVEVGLSMVARLTLCTVIVLGGTIVIVVTAVRLCFIVVARRAVELTIFVEI